MRRAQRERKADEQHDLEDGPDRACRRRRGSSSHHAPFWSCEGHAGIVVGPLLARLWIGEAINCRGAGDERQDLSRRRHQSRRRVIGSGGLRRPACSDAVHGIHRHLRHRTVADRWHAERHMAPRGHGAGSPVLFTILAQVPEQLSQPAARERRRKLGSDPAISAADSAESIACNGSFHRWPSAAVVEAATSVVAHYG